MSSCLIVLAMLVLVNAVPPTLVTVPASYILVVGQTISLSFGPTENPNNAPSVDVTVLCNTCSSY